MVPARRGGARADAQPEPDVEMNDGQNLPPLKFDKPLSWTAGRPIAEGELVKRLQALYDEISKLEQEDLDLDTLVPKAKELVADRLLKHKNKGVQAWAACCIVECLKLFAPNAPYTGKELKDFFFMVIDHIIPALADSSLAYHAQHLAIINSLDDVQSILLISDVPSSEVLTKSLFTACFDVLSGQSKSAEREVSGNVGHVLTSLLVEFIKESQDLPDQVVDIVLAQFLRADPRLVSSAQRSKKASQIDEKQATLLLKEPPAAYTMAQDICNECPDKMARFVLRYFSSVLLDTSMAFTNSSPKRNRRNSNEQENEGPSAESLEESKKAHLLLRELWRAAPDVLQDIIPQLETELSTENTDIRLTAVEAIGDMVAGVGAAGPPQYPALDPTAYPSQSVVNEPDRKTYHFLLTPSSSVSFISRYSSTYSSFLSRKKDKSPIIRAAWTKAIGLILLTSAGAVGLDSDNEAELLEGLGASLVDHDEKVRFAAIEAIESFPFKTIATKLAKLGGVTQENSILYNLTDRSKDVKPFIRAEAIHLCAKLWGVAAGAIAQGNQQVIDAFGGIPTRLFSAYYANDLEIHKALDRALFESLLPLSFPPKARPNGIEGEKSGAAELDVDNDKIRVERLLLLVQSLDVKSRTVLFTKQRQQTQVAKLLVAFLQKCEDFNGGVVDTHAGLSEKEVEMQLNRFIDAFSQYFPDKQRAADDLKKFARLHDRRSYALIRFCCAPESDWSRVRKSIKELSRRLEDSASSSTLPPSVIDTLLTIVYRASVLFYNRSNVPFIIQYSRTDDKGLGSVAHEVLTEISKNQGEIFSTHVQELCKALTADAPSASKPAKASSIEDLKACVEFAQKFPEKMPQDRKFITSLIAYVTHGQPRASKYAVRILMTSAAKKELHAADVYAACAKSFKFEGAGFLSKLAALSQLVLYGANFLDAEEADVIVDIAINQVLTNPKANASKHADTDWSEVPDDKLNAKSWALKILVNRLLAFAPEDDISEAAQPVFKFLDKLVSNGGNISAKAKSGAHASRLRLLAAECLLKLCREKRFDDMLDAAMFERLCLVAQDPLYQVRDGFTKKLMKYLGTNHIRRRFYTPMFLLGFEPDQNLKTSIETWLRSKARSMAHEKDNTFEVTFARLLSLLAHHPDFDINKLDDMAQYILFYLQTVSTRDNISLINNVAQRIKNFGDGIRKGSENMYVLSDLAQAIIKRWDEMQGWNMELLSVKVPVPAGLFIHVEGHGKALEIASKMFVPEELVNRLDDLVRENLKAAKFKKRNRADTGAQSKKRSRGMDKTSTLTAKRIKPTKSPKAKRKSFDDVPPEERRRSGRNTLSKNYKEDSGVDEDGDEPMTGAGFSNGKSNQFEITSDSDDD